VERRQAIHRSYSTTAADDSSPLIDNQLDNVRESPWEGNPLDGGPETGMISYTPRRARRREHGACSLEVRVGSRATTDDAGSYLRCDGIPQRYSVVPASVVGPGLSRQRFKIARTFYRRTYVRSVVEDNAAPPRPSSRPTEGSARVLPILFGILAESRGGTRPDMGNKFKPERTKLRTIGGDAPFPFWDFAEERAQERTPRTRLVMPAR
jgi:hypothetical protein